MKEQDGMKIICGPTGTGMSSTLARHVLELAEAQTPRQITQLEDPVEFPLSTVVPVQRDLP